MHRVHAIPNCNCLLPVHFTCPRYLLSLSHTRFFSLPRTHTYTNTYIKRTSAQNYIHCMCSNLNFLGINCFIWSGVELHVLFLRSIFSSSTNVKQLNAVLDVCYSFGLNAISMLSVHYISPSPFRGRKLRDVFHFVFRLIFLFPC